VFRQANLDAFAKILAEIRRRILKFGRQRRQQDRNAALPTCVELYGGVGTIGLHVVDLVSSLVSSDENPFNEACFNESALALPKDIAKDVSYKPMNASNMVQSKALKQAEVVIVDPPRKGLDDTVLQTLCTEASPQLLVYVSCGFDAFQHDCNMLLKSKWRLDHAEGHLLFPGSDAIETLAIFVAKE
jgi:tRNA/tmRNA/rRNA uracil-C5-methylase (TrmA/RlmC/RlmD family)